MKFQTTYETNADYLESWKRLKVDPRIEKLSESSKGHLMFRFKGTDLFAELAEATSKLVISWHDEKMKKRYFPQFEEVLATRDGSPLKIHPLHANIYRVPIPPPNCLRISWCKKAFRYAREKIDLIPFILVIIVASVALGASQVTLDYCAMNQTGEAVRYVTKMRELFLWITIAATAIGIGSYLLFKSHTRWQFMKRNSNI
jgi:hypothetical protein